MDDTPYSALKQNERAYEIMLLHEQSNISFANLAKKYGISTVRARELYIKLKYKQKDLYIRHISVALGHSGTTQIKEIFWDAYDCYQDVVTACAYLEKKYKTVLTEYRGGEPGMPEQFLKNIPPFKRRLSPKTIARIVEMRENENASFVTIAKELRITRAKAKRTYDTFYHKKVLKLLQPLKGKAESAQEQKAIWTNCLGGTKSPKERYDILTGKKDNH